MDTYKMKVVKLRFNYRQTDNSNTAYHEFDEAEIGKKFDGKLVTKIDMHSAAGEGDRWYFDIVFEDNTMTRTFNPNESYFEPDEGNF